MISETQSREYHLLSDGMTYHGVALVAVLVIDHHKHADNHPNTAVPEYRHENFQL